MRDIVNGMLVKGGKVLMARRSKHRKSYPDVWSFPGGHVEAGETNEQALVRELKEEIGIVPTHYDHHSDLIVSSPNGYDAIFHMFCITEWQGDPSILDHEHSALCWYPLEAAAALDELALSEYSNLLKSLRAGHKQPGY